MRLLLAVLAFGTLLAAQAKRTDREMAHNDSIPEMTEAISARLVSQWEGWKNQDPEPNNAIIADDFNSFSPDGSRHIGRPTAQQMAEQPIPRTNCHSCASCRWERIRPSSPISPTSRPPATTLSFTWPWERSG